MIPTALDVIKDIFEKFIWLLDTDWDTYKYTEVFDSSIFSVDTWNPNKYPTVFISRWGKLENAMLDIVRDASSTITNTGANAVDNITDVQVHIKQNLHMGLSVGYVLGGEPGIVHFETTTAFDYIVPFYVALYFTKIINEFQAVSGPQRMARSQAYFRLGIFVDGQVTDRFRHREAHKDIFIQVYDLPKDFEGDYLVVTYSNANSYTIPQELYLAVVHVSDTNQFENMSMYAIDSMPSTISLVKAYEHVNPLKDAIYKYVTAMWDVK